MTLAVDTSVRHDLERLAAEFDRCARTYRPLFHERLSAWSEHGHELLTEKQWLTFMLSNPEPTSLLRFGWWCWDGPWAISEDEELMGRFTGYGEGLDEFLNLSNTASTLIAEFAPEVIQGKGGYDCWLHLMHRTALLYPSMLLEVEQDFWNRAADDTRTWEAIAADWHVLDGVEIPKHPLVHRFRSNVFTSSSAFLRMILHPESIRTWEDPVVGFPVNVVWDDYPEGQQGFSSTESVEPVPTADNLWRKRDGVYEVRFHATSDEAPRLIPADYLACDHLTRLIEHEGRGVRATDFARKNHGRSRPVASTIPVREAVEFASSDAASPTMNSGGADDERIYDSRALREVRERIERLQQLIDAARQDADDQEIELLKQELRRLQRHMERDFDNTGRPRKLATSQEEKARAAATNALSYFYTILRDEYGLDELANHFADSVKWISEARCFAYRPASLTEWRTATGTYAAKRE